ncbi:hypothetical protein WG66_012557, partial [Moniliophthora roreri]
ASAATARSHPTTWGRDLVDGQQQNGNSETSMWYSIAFGAIKGCSVVGQSEMNARRWHCGSCGVARFGGESLVLQNEEYRDMHPTDISQN